MNNTSTSTSTSTNIRSDIRNVDDIRNRHRGHWFSPENMRFFRTRFCASGRVFGGRYFVTSEQPPRGPRVYTVRVYDAATDSFEAVDSEGRPGLILDVAFSCRKSAIRAARRLGAQQTPAEKIDTFRAKLAEWRENWHRPERIALARELVAMMEANPTLKLVPPWDVLDLIFAHADGKVSPLRST